jgi:hypothetical protein
MATSEGKLMKARRLKRRLKVDGLGDDRGAMGTELRPGSWSRGATMHITTGTLVSLLGAVLLTGCASTTPAPTVTVTATPSVRVVTFNPATSGKLLAARIATRAKTAGMKVTAVECKNFPNIKVGTGTDCQMRVKGVNEGLRATFTLREGHYVLKTQKLTW